MKASLFISTLTAAVLAATPVLAATDFLNVSYDPTRELYSEFNKDFGAYWKAKTGQEVNFKQSHGGSGKQARAVIDGLEADVVTLALAGDVDAIAEKSGLIAKNWEARLPNHSAPYTSTIVFLVRKGNPKAIRDWSDLVKPGVQVITPNPKTSGGARWNYLAAWSYAAAQPNATEASKRAFVKALYSNVKVLDSGARGALTTFAERGIGDVLIAWENEAYLATRELEPGAFEVVVPSRSILAEPSVAIVDKNVDKHGTRALATGYLNYLYSPRGQQIAAENFYRPRNKAIAAQYSKQFLAVKTVDIRQVAGSWANAQKQHFDNGAIFDQIQAELGAR